MKKSLTDSEKLFCFMYAECGSVREAALRAGYKKDPELCGAELIIRKDVQKQIARLKKGIPRPGAAEGLRRLAYGRANDAVKLMGSEDFGGADALDLYNVSEIKRRGDGSVEIKFFDRQKALEKLCLIEARASDGFDAFCRALENSADTLPGEGAQ